MSCFAYLNRTYIYTLLEAFQLTTAVIGLKYSIILVAFMLKVRLHQWWGKTIEEIENDKYILTHVIKGKEVKVIVRYIPNDQHPKGIFTQNGDDISQYAIPFYRVDPEPISADFFFADSLTFI